VEAKKGKKKSKNTPSRTARAPTPEPRHSISPQARSPTPIKSTTTPSKTPRRSSPSQASNKSLSNLTTSRRSSNQTPGRSPNQEDPTAVNGQTSDDANKEVDILLFGGLLI